MQWGRTEKASLGRDHPQRVACCQLFWKNFHSVGWLKSVQDLSLLLYQQMACFTFGVKALLETSIHLTESKAQRPLILLTFSFQGQGLQSFCQEVALVTPGDQMMSDNLVMATLHLNKPLRE